MFRKAEKEAPLSLIAEPNGHVIRICGELSFASAVAGIEAFKPFCAHGQARPIIMDFTQVTHMDSAGLALLLQWKRMAHAAGRSIQFHSLSGQARNLAAVFCLAHLLDPGSTS